MLWENEDIKNIIGGKTSDGVSLLKLFFIDYQKLFNEKKLCASCNNLIVSYHKKYKNKKMEIENTCQFRLKLKYNGIALKFGSATYVNNGNITNEYAKILLDSFGAKIFEKMPTVSQTESIVKPATTPRTKANRNKKR